MCQRIDSLHDVAGHYDALVFDQFGVLHNGATPGEGIARLLSTLAHDGHRLAVLTNSGKRATTNAARLAALGLPVETFTLIMSSGEALWRDIAEGRVGPKVFHPITARDGDAQEWAEGLDITFAGLNQADAVLLMGLPEGSDGAAEAAQLTRAHALPVYCTNPDLASPRPDGRLQISPGQLARDHQDAGGSVTYYGKPHRPIFDSLAKALGAEPDRLLMIGDSLHHDIVGADRAGWDSAFICSGLHAAQFSAGVDPAQTVKTLAQAQGSPCPTYILDRPR